MNTPLTVDVNCVCNSSSRPASSIGYFSPNVTSAGGYLASGSLSHRLHPNTPGANDGPICRVPGHDKHHRSISASPQYYYGAGGANLNKSSMPTSLNAPLLIPLTGNWTRGGSASE